MAKREEQNQAQQDQAQQDQAQQNQAQSDESEQARQSGELNDLNQEVADPNAPRRVADNGEVHDPGNSGLVGTDGVVDGQADKPNG